MALLKSTLSDPVGSAVDTGTKLLGAIDAFEGSKQRRELTGLQIQSEKMKLAQQQNQMQALDDLQKSFGDMPVKDMNKLPSYYAALKETDAAKQEGRDPKYTPEMEDALKTVGTWNHVVSDNADDWDKQAQAADKLNKFMYDAPAKIGPGKHAFNMDNAPSFINTVTDVYGNRINQGDDKFGLNVERDGVKKRLSGILLDNTNPQKPTVSMQVSVESPRKEGMVFKHIGSDFPQYVVGTDNTGLTELGNIDLSKRPVRLNKDGSVSTVLSMGIEEDGKQVVIPKIGPKGQLLSDEEAIAEYEKTGKHLGKFDNREDADLYAERLHSDPMWKKDIETYSSPGLKSVFYDAPVTWGRGGGPNDKVAQIPAQFLHAQINQLDKFFAAALKMRASTPEGAAGLSKEITDRVRERDEDARIMKVLRSMPKGKDGQPIQGQERYDWLLANLPADVPLEKRMSIAKPVTGSLTPAQLLAHSDRQERTDLERKRLEGTLSGTVTKTVYLPGGKPALGSFKKGEDVSPQDLEKKYGKGATLAKPESDKSKRSEERADEKDKRAERKEDGREVTSAGKALGELVGAKDINQIGQVQGVSKGTKQALKERHTEVADLIRKEHISAEEAMSKLDKDKGAIPILKPLSEKKVAEFKKKYPPDKYTRAQIEQKVKDAGYDPAGE